MKYEKYQRKRTDLCFPRQKKSWASIKKKKQSWKDLLISNGIAMQIYWFAQFFHDNQWNKHKIYTVTNKHTHIHIHKLKSIATYCIIHATISTGEQETKKKQIKKNYYCHINLRIFSHLRREYQNQSTKITTKY